jgi:hypothetical protein
MDETRPQKSTLQGMRRSSHNLFPGNANPSVEPSEPPSVSVFQVSLPVMLLPLVILLATIDLW